MIKDDLETVSALVAALAEKVGAQRFAQWFGSHARFSLDEGALVVGVESQFHLNWLRQNFRREIEDVTAQVLGAGVPVSFRLEAAAAIAAGPQATATVKRPGPVSTGRGCESAASGPVCELATIGSSASAVIDRRPAGQSAGACSSDSTNAPRRRFASLESFVVGQGSRLAHCTALSVAQRPGHVSPLLLYGPSGVGKTHLLEGIWLGAKRANPRCQALYLSAEQFTTSFLSALHGSGLPSFRRKHRGLDLLIIDDVQFFEGKRATLGELLHTIDTGIREGRQLVFAADRGPEALAKLGPELVARLQGGLSCPIEPPEADTRLEIVRRMCRSYEFLVPDDVQQFVATQAGSHARALAGALKRLHAMSEAHKRPITLELAHEALGEMVRARTRTVRLNDIEVAVCDVFGLERKSLKAGGKGRAIDAPRMLAMYLARKHTKAGLKEISEYFGRRSHTSVLSASKRVDGWVSTGEPLAVADQDCQVAEVIRRVEQSLMAG